MNNNTRWIFLGGFYAILLGLTFIPYVVALSYNWNIWNFSENRVPSTVWLDSTIVMYFIVLAVFWGVWPALQSRSDEFYARQAKDALVKLETKVLNSVMLSASNSAKFLGEVESLKKILGNQIPSEMRKAHAIMVEFHSDEDRDLLSIHKRVASYTNFYYSASLRIMEMVAKTTLVAEDIDYELSTMIDEWKKIE